MAERPLRILGKQSLELLLRDLARSGEIKTGNRPVAHGQTTIDEDGAGHTARSAKDERLDGIDRGRKALIRKIEDRDVRLGPRLKAA